MAQSQCIRIPLHPEHEPAFVEWLRSLSGRPEELRAALAAEGMLVELVFLERTPEGTSIVLYTRAHDLAAANAAYLTSSHPIDREMREWQTRAFRLDGARQLEILLEHIA